MLKWSKYLRTRVHGLGPMRKEERVVWIIMGRSSADKIVATDKGFGLYLFVSLDAIKESAKKKQRILNRIQKHHNRKTFYLKDFLKTLF